MEFEEGLSNEAKFARSMDRLEPLLQNTLNNGGPRKEYGVKFLRFTTKAIKEGSSELWDYAEKLLESNVEKRILEK